MGGLGYCRELRFTTKAKGQGLVSTNTWNCEELKQSINGDDKFLDTATILDRVTEFEQHEYPGQLDDHFFIVEMIEVHTQEIGCLMYLLSNPIYHRLPLYLSTLQLSASVGKLMRNYDGMCPPMQHIPYL